MSVISLNNVTVTRGGNVVLRDITLAIEQGEFIGVIGPNGAGKTTLFRSILGLQPLAGGGMLVFGAPPRRGNTAIGYMPQAHSDFSGQRLCGFDILANAAQGYRLGLPLTSAATKEHVMAALRAVDARTLSERPISTLSGGQRQRLLLAAALLGSPRILLLDEPFISLDPPAQSAIIGLIHRLQKTLGLTVLLAAHDLNPLLGVIDRVLYLGGGSAALGTVDEIITTETLSKLYNGEVEVVRAEGRIFVVSDSINHHA
jgi:zinc/manganese transport system ATP-binding protein